MNSNTIKLTCAFGGYVVENRNWKGYQAYANADILAHDIFEHSSTDKGGKLDEIRSTGAKLRFTDVVIFDDGWTLVFVCKSVYDKLYKKDEKTYKYIFHIKQGRCNLPRLAKMLKKTGQCGYQANMLRVLTAGYNKALRYNKKAYERVMKIPFSTLHSHGKDLLINTQTGRYKQLAPAYT